MFLNDMLQAVKPNVFLYADDLCTNINTLQKFEKYFIEAYENAYDWLVDNKANIHFGYDE